MIIELRKQGLSVRKIKKLLGCGSATSSKYCALVSLPEEIIDISNREMIELKKENQIIYDISSNLHVSQNRILRRAKKAWLVEKAGGKCQNCGYNKCVHALDFNHLGNKDFAVSHCRNKKLTKMIIEVNKCILLCKNCHMEWHLGLIKDYIQINITEQPPPRLIKWYVEFMGGVDKINF